MEHWHIYLFTRLESVKFLIMTLTILGSIITALCGCGVGISRQEFEKAQRTEYKQTAANWKGWHDTWVGIIRYSFPVTIVAICLNLIIPTQKEFAAIYLLPKISNSEFMSEVSKLPASLTKVLNLKLEAYISDMVPEKASK